MRSSISSLPPGQVAADLRRFGLPRFAGIHPVPAPDPAVTVTGLVRYPTQVPVADLLGAAERIDRASDLHCVTTWSAGGLRWSGVPFAAVHARLVRRVAPHPRTRWVTFVGLDGYRSCLLLEDALDDGVLLADTLDGAPLGAAHGAPLRVVAPAHYGYKSVKHLCAIEYRLRYDRGSAGLFGHPRGRVAREERSRLLPGYLWRRIWPTMLPAVRRRYRRFDPGE
jgi:DMSO/TMAO reductase YedYZ molybdopterin-dependent catalytic subunit